MKKEKFATYIQSFDFKRLFNELGWDNFSAATPVIIDGAIFKLYGVAEKRNFPVFECAADDETIPSSNHRKQIEHQLSSLHHHHFVIYTDSDKTRQVWQLPYKEENKPKRMIEVTWRKGQDVEPLFQRLKNILFTLVEEDEITLIDVIERMNRNFAVNNEQVTKRFYTEFKRHHTVFLDFIRGIDDDIANKDNHDKQWYASLMLNRLMFCYFIQKKGFLDQDINYLQTKLAACKRLEGSANFYGFYRSFLLKLFHDSLAKPKGARTNIEPPVAFGRIPYLNGGLFDVHQLERQYPSIAIDDNVFERIFNFFDEWNWHLDTRIEATGRDINPDVIGYIFEKYINDRAAMGAYYTKEDITEYIGKNTIIPFLLDKVASKHAISNLWEYITSSGDDYIYNAVKKGADLVSEIPAEIAVGIDSRLPNLLERRKDWNTPTPEAFGLPTEIWRETITRLQRYFDIKHKIVSGQIRSANDLITYNLNIRQAVQDFVQQTEDAVFIKELYKALTTVTILDPTCGSGAFLFAAMNVLEPLYEACIERMEDFVNDLPGKHKFFEEQLAEIKRHPNLKYYIFKTIILNNLYGVDIMHEAVEVAKLRLFLKLVAEVDVSLRKPNFGIEPLPDIDFNIRAGNTLVGFATETQLAGTIQAKEGLFSNDFDWIKEECLITAKAFDRFQNCQLINDMGSEEHRAAKAELHRRLKSLNDKLDRYCAHTYGIDAELKPAAFAAWKQSHQPFHWFAEFYCIIHANSGFDVIIGNPPYVEYSSVRKIYTLNGYDCFSSGNLYAFVIERCNRIMKDKSRIGMIIQMSAFCTPRMESFQKICFNNSFRSYISFFDDRPGKLFDGLEHIRVSICINEYGLKVKNKEIGTSNYIKFKTEFRQYLFQNVQYYLNDNSIKETSVLKVNSILEHKIIDKVWSNKNRLASYLSASRNSNFVYYGYGYGYFAKILNYQSHFKGENVEGSTGDKFIYVYDDFDRDIFVALLNSSLFYWFYVNYSDGHNFTKYVIGSIPFDYPKRENEYFFKELTKKLMNDLVNNSKRKFAFYKSTGNVEYDEYYPKLSKPIIDEIDKVLAKHYGFTEEELDFIINYDIKYRMGKVLEEDSND